MGVYIDGVKMPAVCGECFALDDRYDYPTCMITSLSEGYTFDAREKKMGWCPLTEDPSIRTAKHDQGEQKRVVTNADKVRAMSNEELAEWVETFASCRLCPVACGCNGEALVSRASCMLRWLDWMNREAE